MWGEGDETSPNVLLRSYNIVSSTLEIIKIEGRVMKSPTKIQKHVYIFRIVITMIIFRISYYISYFVLYFVFRIIFRISYYISHNISYSDNG